MRIVKALMIGLLLLILSSFGCASTNGWHYSGPDRNKLENYCWYCRTDGIFESSKTLQASQSL